MASDGLLGRGGSAVKRTPEKEGGRKQGRREAKEGGKEGGRKEGGRKERRKRGREGERKGEREEESLKVVFCSLNMSNDEMSDNII